MFGKFISLQKASVLLRFFRLSRKDGTGAKGLHDLEIRAGLTAGLSNEIVGTFKGPGTTGGIHVVRFTSRKLVEYLTIQSKPTDGSTTTLEINGLIFNEAPPQGLSTDLLHES